MRSRWIRTPLLARSRFWFYLAAFWELVPPAIRTWLHPQSFRSVAFVQANYDRERQAQLARFKTAPPDLDTYIFGDTADSDFVLLAGRTAYRPLSDARRNVANTLLDLIAAATVPGDTVIEFGCGDGRNLIFLKHKLPDRQFIGLELSSCSVDLCHAAASHYGVPVLFEAADVTKDLSAVLPKANVCFSVHALEQMPRGFQQAIRNMLSAKPKQIILLEPIHELYAWSIRGILGACRARVMDRLSGLPRFLQQVPVRIVRATPLGHADNPLNETCVVNAFCSLNGN